MSSHHHNAMSYDRGAHQYPMVSGTNYGAHQQFTNNVDTAPLMGKDAQPSDRVVRKQACPTGGTDTDPYWSLSLESACMRAVVILGGSFLLVMLTLLVSVSYDTVSNPLAATMVLAFCQAAVSIAFPHHSFTPAMTFVDALVPITPCSPRPSLHSYGHAEPSKMRQLKDSIMGVVYRLVRALWDLIFQVVGATLASLLVWRGMVQDNVGIADRFNTHVRSDISDDANGGGEVFMYVMFANVIYALCYYGLRFTPNWMERSLQMALNPKMVDTDPVYPTTCVLIQRHRAWGKLVATGVVFWIVSAAFASMFGIGSLNLLISLGPSIATSLVPAFYSAYVFGQVLGFLAVAVFFRGVFEFSGLRTCGGCAGS